MMSLYHLDYHVSIVDVLLFWYHLLNGRYGEVHNYHYICCLSYFCRLDLKFFNNNILFDMQKSIGPHKGHQYCFL